MRPFFLSAGIALACVSMAQGDPAMLDKIAKEGKNNSKTYATLKEFTSKFGPRLTGSPNLYEAQKWAVARFKSMGYTNVRLEKWGEVPVGFYRGKRQSVKMTKPWPKEFVFTTPAWTPGTNGKIKINPILEPTTMEEFNKVKDKLEGGWMVMRRSAGIRGPQGNASEVEQALEKINLAGKIYGTADERVHTGGRFGGLTWENLPKQVDLRITKSCYDDLVLALKAGRETELELDIENHFVKGPVPQYNVIADLVGTEKPDEMVIVCGHFDSWNGPGSVGANDNGTGSAVAIEAARILAKVGAKPKRTIRFILWSGEEQGLLGSRAYVQQHKDEWSKISAVFNDDGGTGYQGGYTCVESMKDMLTEAIKKSQETFPEFPMTINVVQNFPLGGSSDHAAFSQVGIPGFFTQESGPKADYGFVWHTQNDRPEFSVPEYLVQSATNAALVAFNVASAKELMARVPERPATGTRTEIPSIGGAAKHYHDISDHDHDHDDEWYEYVYDTLVRWMLRAN